MSKKILMPVFLCLLIVGAIFFFNPPTKNNKNVNVPAEQDFPAILAEIEQQIDGALSGGGIHPDTYSFYLKKIAELESIGVEPERVALIKTKMSQLSVGGKAPNQPAVATASPAPKVPPISVQPVTAPAKTSATDARELWMFRDGVWKWAREGTPPLCPDPLILAAPVDPDLVMSILYPGQIRGKSAEDFKSHGGFQLKAGTKNVDIKAPMDGYLVSVAKFTDEFGLHYSLTFMHPCGIRFGGGHWGSLPPDIQVVMDKIPLKGYGDSRTELISPPYFVKKGQIIATGLQENANPDRPGFDWGLADLRQPNDASKNQRFRDLYGYAPWHNYYGLCWLDLLPTAEQSYIKSLPGGDGVSGKSSEYCK